MVAGIFEPYLIAPLDQCPCDQTQGTLIASSHEHLARRAGNAAGNGKIGCDRLTQLPVPSRVEIGHAGRRQRTCLARDEPRPQLSAGNPIRNGGGAISAASLFEAPSGVAVAVGSKPRNFSTRSGATTVPAGPHATIHPSAASIA